MLVYVLNRDGKALMPCRPQKARKLLQSQKAVIVQKEPFTIKLLYGSSGFKQKVVLGVDAGSKHIGLSVTTEKAELYAADVELRNDIVNLLSSRREARRARRNRKTRYRKPRFKNRVKSKNKGWLAPSIEQKIGTHLKAIEDVCKILPVSKIIVETASFDIQKIKNPDIKGKEYQEGEQLGFWNVREYVLFRDNHTCQCCKGKSKDKILNVHHIESRKTGGDAPNNLITLCEKCHTGFHNGTVKLPETIKRGMKFNDATFMGVMRKTLLKRLKELYIPNGMEVWNTYGYITKYVRIREGLPKDHYIDARCVSGNPKAIPLGSVYYYRKVRRHNRQIHKFNVLKGGKRKLHQASYEVKGFRLFDKVLFEGKECFITGRRTSGYFVIKGFDGTVISNSVSYKKLQLIDRANSFIHTRKEVSGNSSQARLKPWGFLAAML